MNKKNIIILIPLVWCYRNFYLTGIIRDLEKYFNVYIAVPEIGVSSFLKNGFEREKIIILKSPVKRKFSNWIFKLIKVCHSKVYPINTEKIFESFRKTACLKFKIKYFISFDFPSLFFSNSIGLEFLKYMERILFYKNNQKECLKILKDLNPAFVLSTANVVDAEWPIFRVAQRIKIPTIAHVLSFDNITSRGYLPIDSFDHYWVWNKQMKEELIKLYAVDSTKITLTGTPQFDFHRDSQYKWSRAKTLEKLGFENNGSYILYCANHYQISPEEPELVDSILIQLLKKYPNIKIVLRLHPMDKYERWDALLAKHSNIFLSIPWTHDNPETIYWGEPTVEDLAVFSNTLRHAEVMLNIASTVSIDAAITDTPTICIGYHPANEKESTFYHDVHYSKHYKPIMELGSSPLVVSIEELIEKIALQIEDRNQLSKEREATVNYFIPTESRLASTIITEKLMAYV